MQKSPPFTQKNQKIEKKITQSQKTQIMESSFQIKKKIIEIEMEIKKS